jgi:hypothetical protein
LEKNSSNGRKVGLVLRRRKTMRTESETGSIGRSGQSQRTRMDQVDYGVREKVGGARLADNAYTGLFTDQQVFDEAQQRDGHDRAQKWYNYPRYHHL